MTDDVFWDSSLAFIFEQFSRLKEMNEQLKKESNTHQNNKNKRSNYEERIEKKSFRKLSEKEIAELRARANG